jgi:multidrug transporter EmrE-like cation transporter
VESVVYRVEGDGRLTDGLVPRTESDPVSVFFDCRPIVFETKDTKIGVFTTDKQKTRIADIHARLRIHNEAVKEGREKEGGNPEFREYDDRWHAFVREMNSLGERANSFVSWVTDDEIDNAEGRLGLMIFEWNELLPLRIQTRRLGSYQKILEEGVPKLTKAPPGTPTSPPMPLPETKPKLERSASSTPYVPPRPPPPHQPEGAPLAVRGAALFTLAAVTVAATAAMKTDGHRAAGDVLAGLQGRKEVKINRSVALTLLFAINLIGIFSTYAFATHNLRLACCYTIWTFVCGVIATTISVSVLDLRDDDFNFMTGVGTGIICHYCGLSQAARSPAAAILMVFLHQTVSGIAGASLKRMT